MRALITGSGNMGQAIAAALTARGDEVAAIAGRETGYPTADEIGIIDVGSELSHHESLLEHIDLGLASAEKPNLLFVIADDCTFRDIGCYGGQAHTPHIDKLASEGPFTVFAPTDEAFAKLPDGALDDLLKPANKSKLAGILANHVVPGKLMAADVKTMKATNVSGQDLAIEVHDGAVMVDGARVVQADLAADNGVIHTIDTVIMPKSDTGPKSDKPKDHPAH